MSNAPLIVVLHASRAWRDAVQLLLPYPVVLSLECAQTDACAARPEQALLLLSDFSLDLRQCNKLIQLQRPLVGVAFRSVAVLAGLSVAPEPDRSGDFFQHHGQWFAAVDWRNGVVFVLQRALALAAGVQLPTPIMLPQNVQQGAARAAQTPQLSQSNGLVLKRRTANKVRRAGRLKR